MKAFLIACTIAKMTMFIPAVPTAEAGWRSPAFYRRQIRQNQREFQRDVRQWQRSNRRVIRRGFYRGPGIYCRGPYVGWGIGF